MQLKLLITWAITRRPVDRHLCNCSLFATCFGYRAGNGCMPWQPLVSLLSCSQSRRNQPSPCNS
jgi:hypothetical protein